MTPAPLIVRSAAELHEDRRKSSSRCTTSPSERRKRCSPGLTGNECSPLHRPWREVRGAWLTSDDAGIPKPPHRGNGCPSARHGHAGNAPCQ